MPLLRMAWGSEKDLTGGEEEAFSQVSQSTKRTDGGSAD